MLVARDGFQNALVRILRVSRFSHDGAICATSFGSTKSNALRPSAVVICNNERPPSTSSLLLHLREQPARWVGMLLLKV
jgi:hypothetical protein